MFSNIDKLLLLPLLEAEQRGGNEDKTGCVQMSVPRRFCSAPVCKHASKARDPVDALRTNVQSGNGGVCRWAWRGGVAVKMSMSKVFH